MSGATLFLLAVFFLGPIAMLFAQLDHGAFVEMLTLRSFPKVLYVTFASATGGALLSLAMGTFFARHFALYRWKSRRIQRLLALVPYLVPNFVLATAYVVAWNPVTGLLNPLVRFPFGLYGLWGMIVLFAVCHMPVVLLMLEDKFRRVDVALREAARLSGASTWTIFSRIELPMVLPTALSAFALCFALNISAFAIPAWIGAPKRMYPLTYKIYQAIQVGGADGIPRAASLSIVLFLIALVPLAFSRWMRRKEGAVASVSGKASRQGDEEPSPRASMLFQSVFWVSQLFVWIAPLLALFASTFVKPGCLQHEGLACFSNASFHTYHYVLFELEETGMALQGSFIYGSLGALFVIALAILALMLLYRKPQSLNAVEWIFALPVATPGAIIALALIVSYSGRFGINLYNTAWIVVVAFVIKHMSLAFQPLRTGLAGVSGTLFEAARLSGARTPTIWRQIVLPILAPECMGGFFLVLIPILGELTMSVFLASPSYRSLGTLLFDLQDYADQASAAALSILLVFIILIVNELARLLSKGRLGY